MLASVLEQKVWIMTSSRLYANLYVFIVGHPGVGKTRTIRAVKAYGLEIPDFHFAPTSMTAASLVDSLVEAKRMIINLPNPPMEYNSMLITADELGAFMHKYDDEMIGILSAFYDPDPYGQNRRGKDIRIKIKSPQLSILSGTTPSNLLKLMPEGAWEQGFTSRIILVYSSEKIIGDDFATIAKPMSPDLIHDIKVINSLSGQFEVTEDYRNCVNNWRALGEQPAPGHPKLTHYITRRRTHLYKLSMISAIDRSNVLLLTRDDFNRAMNWLVEAEVFMSEVFKAGSIDPDSKVMDEIYHFVMIGGGTKGMNEDKIVKFTREKVPAHSVMRILEIMERSGMIRAISNDPRSGLRTYIAVPTTP